MEEKKIDRRVARTKEAIREAFFILADKKPVEKITIRELCDLANINRTSFYDHYWDYPDLVNSLETEIANSLFNQFDGLFSREDSAEVTMRKYLHLIKNSKEIKILFSNFGCQKCLQMFEDALKEQTFKDWLKREEITKVQADYLFRYIVSGGWAVIQQWYQGGFAEPEEQIQALLTEVITKGLYSFFPSKR